jgi:hypothetical protein
MNCPFDLPVRVEILPIKVADYDRPYSIVGKTVESVGEIYAYLGNKDRADYIVQAINNYEKFKTVLQHLVDSATKYPEDYATKDLNKVIPYIIKEATEALKDKP